MGFASHIVSGSKLPIKVSFIQSRNGLCYSARLQPTRTQHLISESTTTAQLCHPLDIGSSLDTRTRFTLCNVNLSNPKCPQAFTSLQCFPGRLQQPHVLCCAGIAASSL